MGVGVWDDSDISHPEYLNVVKEIEECALRSGADFEVEYVEGIALFSSSDIADLGALDDCEAGDHGAIRALYENRQKDPQKHGEIRSQLECLVASGVAEEGSSLDEAIDAAQRLVENDRVSTVNACLYDPEDLFQEPGAEKS